MSGWGVPFVDAKLCGWGKPFIDDKTPYSFSQLCRMRPEQAPYKLYDKPYLSYDHGFVRVQFQGCRWFRVGVLWKDVDIFKRALYEAARVTGPPDLLHPYKCSDTLIEALLIFKPSPTTPPSTPDRASTPETPFTPPTPSTAPAPSTPENPQANIMVKEVIPVYVFDHKPRLRDLEPTMASSEVDTKFLARFAGNLKVDSPFLSSNLFRILGNLTMLSRLVIEARKQLRLDPSRKPTKLYCTIIWYACMGLQIVEEIVIPMVTGYTELRCLAHKLRASYYHLYVLFHNSPAIALKAQVHTPPGLKSPRERIAKLDKGKGVDKGTLDDPFGPDSVQPTHPLEGGAVGGEVPLPLPKEFSPDFLVKAADFRPLTLSYFEEACALGDKHLWGSHPLCLSAKVEMCAFLYDCMYEREKSRQLAKATIAEVYNAKEGMDDDMFEDAAELVGILGRMMKRGLGTSGSAAGSSGTQTTPGVGSASMAMPSPGMLNPI